MIFSSNITLSSFKILEFLHKKSFNFYRHKSKLKIYSYPNPIMLKTDINKKS